MAQCMDKSQPEHEICGGTLISFVMRKAWPILPPLVGLAAGRLTDWQVKCNIFKFSAD